MGAVVNQTLSVNVEDKKLNQEGKNNKFDFKKIDNVALKALCILGMVTGGVLAIGGAAVLTYALVVSGALLPLLAIGAYIGSGALYLTYIFFAHPVTALGAVVTLPIAGVAFAYPFVLTICGGALPGIGLISLSAWGWSKL